jgi:hypothetical protein
MSEATLRAVADAAVAFDDLELVGECATPDECDWPPCLAARDLRDAVEAQRIEDGE